MEEKDIKNSTTVHFSFKTLFSNLRKKWILSLSVGLIALVISFTGLFLHSNKTSTYISTFRIEWPGIELQQFPNGIPFNYRDIVSENNLTRVKNCNKEFENIDVKSMFYNNDIEIEEEIKKKNDSDVTLGYNYYYTITVSQNYFDDDAQARLFIKSLIEDSTYGCAKEQIDEYKILNYFKSQSEKTEYTEFIFNIDNQVKIQKEVLSDLVKDSSAEFIFDTENNISLGDLVIEYNSFLKNNDYKILESEVFSNNYVRNYESYEKDFKSRVAAIDLQIAENDRKIQALKNSFVGNYGQETVPVMVADLVLKNEDLKTEKIYYENCLNSGGTYNQDFDNNINAYQNKLIEFNNKIEEAYKSINSPKSTIEYSKNRILYSNETGLIKIILFSLAFIVLVEFLLSLLLTYFPVTRRNSK